MVTASFDFGWPEKVENLFDVYWPVRKVTQLKFSVDCLFDSRSNETSSIVESYTETGAMNVFYLKLITVAMLPILVFFICSGIWLGIGIIRKSQVDTESRIVASLVIVLFLLHGSIAVYMFSIFNCYDVDHEKRIYTSLEIKCYVGSYYFYAFGVALPGIIVWGLGIPFFTWLRLRREKN